MERNELRDRRIQLELPWPPVYEALVRHLLADFDNLARIGSPFGRYSHSVWCTSRPDFALYFGLESTLSGLLLFLKICRRS